MIDQNWKLDNAKRKIDKAKGVVNRAKRIFDNWQHKINRLCRTRHCGSRRSELILYVIDYHVTITVHMAI